MSATASIWNNATPAEASSWTSASSRRSPRWRTGSSSRLRRRLRLSTATTTALAGDTAATSTTASRDSAGCSSRASGLKCCGGCDGPATRTSTPCTPSGAGARLRRTRQTSARHAGWYEKAANAGHVDSMYALGVLHSDLTQPPKYRGGPALVRAGRRRWPHRRDVQPRIPVREVDRAAEYRGGARRWLQRAADTGHTDSMYTLGFLLPSSM